jgi:uncharacterized protein
MTKTHHSIDYVEFSAENLTDVRAFYGNAFGWQFTDYGPDYTCPTNAGLDGGFFTAETPVKPLVVLFSSDLEASLQSVTAHGGKITREIFDFPGGRRFHFTDPAGNELAVWSDT